MSMPAFNAPGQGSAEPLLELRGISKGFSGIPVLKDVSLGIHAGEIHALVGENGAGKSTLLKIIFGAHRADNGSMRLNGAAAEFKNPHEALKSGVSMVHQEISLVPQLT